MTQKFFETANLVSAFVPVDMQTGANTGDWVGLTDYQRCVIVLFRGAGTAGDDPAFVLKQATDNAGTGSKDLTFTVVYSKVGTQTGIADFTRNTQTAATTYTDAASAEAESVIAVEVSSEDLDVDNSFSHVQLSVADIGGNAQLGCGFYLMLDPRHASQTPPSAIA